MRVLVVILLIFVYSSNGAACPDFPDVLSVSGATFSDEPIVVFRPKIKNASIYHLVKTGSDYLGYDHKKKCWVHISDKSYSAVLKKIEKNQADCLNKVYTFKNGVAELNMSSEKVKDKLIGRIYLDDNSGRMSLYSNIDFFGQNIKDPSKPYMIITSKEKSKTHQGVAGLGAYSRDSGSLHITGYRNNQPRGTFASHNIPSVRMRSALVSLAAPKSNVTSAGGSLDLINFSRNTSGCGPSRQDVAVGSEGEGGELIYGERPATY